MDLLSACYPVTVYNLSFFFFLLLVALCYFYLSGALKVNGVKMLVEGLGKICVAGATGIGWKVNQKELSLKYQVSNRQATLGHIWDNPDLNWYQIWQVFSMFIGSGCLFVCLTITTQRPSILYSEAF